MKLPGLLVIGGRVAVSLFNNYVLRQDFVDRDFTPPTLAPTTGRTSFTSSFSVLA